MPNIELAFWYASRSKVQLREAYSHFQRFRYPECVFCAQESIELGLKSIFEFLGQGYPHEHDVFANSIDKILRSLSQSNPEFNNEWPRIILISERWGNSARRFSRYGEQSLGIPGNQVFHREGAQSSYSDAREIQDILHKVEKSIRFEPPIKIGILNGYVEGDEYGETTCADSPFTNYNSSAWMDFFNSLNSEEETRYDTTTISISEISNRYSIIINPFGEMYPEKDIQRRLVFDIIKNYVSDGGIYVSTGGFAFYYAWDVNPNVVGERRKALFDTQILIPRPNENVPEGNGAMQYGVMIPFSGTLLWKELGARTTSDSQQHAGAFIGEVFQEQEDIDIAGSLTDVLDENVIQEFRALTSHSERVIPLLRMNRPDFGVVYPIGAISEGYGYFILGGMNVITENEFVVLAQAVIGFCNWYSGSEG